MIIKHGRYIFREIHQLRKGLWAFFLDCAFRVLIGWAGELRSRGKIHWRQKDKDGKGVNDRVLGIYRGHLSHFFVYVYIWGRD